MRVMVIIKSTLHSERGVKPSREYLDALQHYNAELVQAGVMEAGEALQPSRQGMRVMFAGKERVVSEGPFASTQELVAGFWLWQVKSMDEAIAWAKRWPNPIGEEAEIEIRPLAAL